MKICEHTKIKPTISVLICFFVPIVMLALVLAAMSIKGPITFERIINSPREFVLSAFLALLLPVAWFFAICGIREYFIVHDDRIELRLYTICSTNDPRYKKWFRTYTIMFSDIKRIIPMYGAGKSQYIVIELKNKKRIIFSLVNFLHGKKIKRLLLDINNKLTVVDDGYTEE